MSELDAAIDEAESIRTELSVYLTKNYNKDNNEMSNILGKEIKRMNTLINQLCHIRMRMRDDDV